MELLIKDLTQYIMDGHRYREWNADMYIANVETIKYENAFLYIKAWSGTIEHNYTIHFEDYSTIKIY